MVEAQCNNHAIKNFLISVRRLGFHIRLLWFLILPGVHTALANDTRDLWIKNATIDIPHNIGHIYSCATYRSNCQLMLIVPVSLLKVRFSKVDRREKEFITAEITDKDLRFAHIESFSDDTDHPIIAVRYGYNVYDFKSGQDLYILQSASGSNSTFFLCNKIPSDQTFPTMCDRYEHVTIRDLVTGDSIGLTLSYQFILSDVLVLPEIDSEIKGLIASLKITFHS